MDPLIRFFQKLDKKAKGRPKRIASVDGDGRAGEAFRTTAHSLEDLWASL